MAGVGLSVAAGAKTLEYAGSTAVEGMSDIGYGFQGKSEEEQPSYNPLLTEVHGGNQDSYNEAAMNWFSLCFMGYAAAETGYGMVLWAQQAQNVMIARQQAAVTKGVGRTTAADWTGKTNELAKSAPINIPDNATVKIQPKTGYDQITYKWNDGTYKYEVRWHTKTPGAPAGQGNTWVIERITPGTPSGQQSVTHILTGEGQWTTRYEWQQAITAFQNGTATDAQKMLLENGHWPGL